MAYVTFDPVADCAYVYLKESERSHRTEVIDDSRNADYAACGTVIGVEFIGVSDGLDLRGIPRAVDIRRLIQRSGLPLIIADYI